MGHEHAGLFAGSAGPLEEQATIRKLFQFAVFKHMGEQLGQERLQLFKLAVILPFLIPVGDGAAADQRLQMGDGRLPVKGFGSLLHRLLRLGLKQGRADQQNGHKGDQRR